MSRGRHCEVLTDDDGTVLARVQLARCPSDAERAALVAMFRTIRDGIAADTPGPVPAPGDWDALR